METMADEELIFFCGSNHQQATLRILSLFEFFQGLSWYIIMGEQ